MCFCIPKGRKDSNGKNTGRPGGGGMCGTDGLCEGKLRAVQLRLGSGGVCLPNSHSR